MYNDDNFLPRITNVFIYMVVQTTTRCHIRHHMQLLISSRTLFSELLQVAVFFKGEIWGFQLNLYFMWGQFFDVYERQMNSNRMNLLYKFVYWNISENNGKTQFWDVLGPKVHEIWHKNVIFGERWNYQAGGKEERRHANREDNSLWPLQEKAK